MKIGYLAMATAYAKANAYFGQKIKVAKTCEEVKRLALGNCYELVIC